MRINDEFLEFLGKFYRKICGDNAVLLTADRRPITFESFIEAIVNIRDRRGLLS